MLVLLVVVVGLAVGLLKLSRRTVDLLRQSTRLSPLVLAVHHVAVVVALCTGQLQIAFHLLSGIEVRVP